MDIGELALIGTYIEVDNKVFFQSQTPEKLKRSYLIRLTLDLNTDLQEQASITVLIDECQSDNVTSLANSTASKDNSTQEVEGLSVMPKKEANESLQKIEFA